MYVHMRPEVFEFKAKPGSSVDKASNNLIYSDKSKGELPHSAFSAL